MLVAVDSWLVLVLCLLTKLSFLLSVFLFLIKTKALAVFVNTFAGKTGLPGGLKLDKKLQHP